MPFTFKWPAHEDEHFAPGFLDHAVGCRYPFWTGRAYATVRILGYEIQDSARSLIITAEEVDDQTATADPEATDHRADAVASLAA